MRRRRRQLQVSTFPFMAVLLCAMGSLIFLLLVLDRQAKLAAQAKAARSLQETEEEQARQLARLRAEQEAEWQRRQQELREYLLREEEEVLGQLANTQTQQAGVEQQIAAKQEENNRLAAVLHQEQGRLEQLKLDVQQRQTALGQAKEKTEKSQQDLARLAAELDQLELALDSLKKLRTRQQQSYSVVPYKGNRGDNRKPFYLECVENGIVFHPERQELNGENFSPLHVRKELDQRIASRLPQEKTQQPYLFVLVRPEGLKSYYDLNAALAGLKVDVGYELIDSNWLLDFSEDGKAGPATMPAAAAVPPNLIGSAGTGKAVMGHQGGSYKSGGGKSQSNAAGAGQPGGEPGAEKGTESGQGEKPGKKPELEADSGEPGIPPPPDSLAMKPVKPSVQKPVPLSKLLGNRDWNITFTCDAKGATLLLTGEQFSLAMLQARYHGEHPLRKAVREQVARKQATVRPGEPPYRPMLRFEVPPDGLKAYLLAYAVLDDLQLPVIRHNVKPQLPTLEDYYRK